MCLRVSYKKKNMNNFFGSLKSLKKGVETGVGFGGGTADPHQNATDPQHCFFMVHSTFFLLLPFAARTSSGTTGSLPVTV